MIIENQGMSDRRFFDCNRYIQSFFRKREVIGDLHLKKRSQGDRDRNIWDRDLAIIDRQILFWRRHLDY